MAGADRLTMADSAIAIMTGRGTHHHRVNSPEVWPEVGAMAEAVSALALFSGQPGI